MKIAYDADMALNKYYYYYYKICKTIIIQLFCVYNICIHIHPLTLYMIHICFIYF